ncbi:hypothetical protein GCM10010341_61640 [Streptomyces noursei]|nr:hypothetical protein GCM10010341_61640 [Streptomyces noursei]
MKLPTAPATTLRRASTAPDVPLDGPSVEIVMTEAFPAHRARPDRARHRELPPHRAEFAAPGRNVPGVPDPPDVSTPSLRVSAASE